MPNDQEMREIADRQGISVWLRDALLSALERDPVEAAADAGLLAAVLDQRLRAKVAEAEAHQVIEAAREAR
jgi:hypothetical protein